MSDKTLPLEGIETKLKNNFSAAPQRFGMVSQIFVYAPALFIPGLVNLLALSLYTRVLGVEAYGRYAIALAVVVTVKMVAFEWLRLGLFRFFQGAQRNGRLSALLSTTIAAFVAISSLVSLVWFAFLGFMPVQKALKIDLWLGLPLLLTWALFEQILQMNRAALAPVRYGLLSAIRAVLCLAIALGFIILFRQGEKGLMFGLIFGTIISVLIDLPRWIKQIAPHLIERVLTTDLLYYGMPLAVTFALNLFISTADRFLLQYYLGSAAVGLYAVGYDLAQQTLMLLIGVVQMAAYPLVLKSLEEAGEAAAKQQLKKFCIAILLISLPASVGFALVAHPLSALLLDKAFQKTAESLIPWIALSTFLMGLKVFYFDLAFQIAIKTKMQILPSVVAAVVLIILDVCWIPLYGLMGAAYATVVAYAAAFIISVLLGRKVVRLPFPLYEFVRITLATIFMAVFIISIPTGNAAWIVLIEKVIIGASFYTFLIWLMDVGEMRRNILFSILHHIKKKEEKYY